MVWKLFFKGTDIEAKPGENLGVDERGTTVLESGSPPHKPSSSGRVYVKQGETRAEYFPHVFGLEWREV